MRVLPLALIGAGCLLLATLEVRSDANVPATAAAQPTTAKHMFARDCAARDVAAVIWVEKQAEAEEMSAPLLAEAAFAVLRARNACLHGQVADAHALYDSVLMPAGQKR